jgi:RNA polymerase sigma-70 factor (ECF subfamily)
VVKADQSRFEDLLQRYVPALRRLAWSYARDASEAEDLFQEIAMAIWTALPNFRGDSSERTWLYRVAHNTAISFVSSRKRRAAREQNVVPPVEPAAFGVTPERAAIDRQRQLRLWSAVQELALAERQIVLLYLEGLSAGDIEAVTGHSAGSIATRLSRIRQRLASRIRAEEVRR